MSFITHIEGFYSDNGAEGAHLNIGWEALEQWAEQCCDNSLENLGNGDSYIWYGPNWTWASSGGYRMYKQFTTEGGIWAPAIVHFPQQLQQGAMIDEFVTVKDVLPTILELTGVDHPEKLKELVQEWESYAHENGVILPDYAAPYTTYTY